MTVVLVGNTRSGRGGAGKLLDRFERALGGSGFAVERRELPVRPTGSPGRDDPEVFAGARVVAAVGGDGTVNAVAGACLRTGTPVYHVPAGNENLFARSFGMSRDPRLLARSIRRGAVRMMDTGRCNGLRFLIMASVGPDAGVIARLHASRARPTGHLAYAGPVIREAANPTLPVLDIRVDGEPIARGRRGWLVVGNMPEYGCRLDPASRADPFCGVFDVVFMPAENLRDCLGWAVRARTGRHRRDRRCVCTRGRTVSVESDSDIIYQFDGECPARFSKSLRLEIEPGVLPVLVP